MLVNYLVLSIACCIALTRPVYGIGLLLLLEESIFYFGTQYASVDLPIGHASPMDVLIICILLGALKYSHRRQETPTAWPAPRFSVGSLLRRAVVPYVIWIAVCSAAGLTLGTFDSSFTVAVRGILSILLPWALVPAVWLLRNECRTILRLMIATATITAIVHLAITVFDVRSVMMAAYYEGDMLARVSLWRATEIDRSDVVRALPQGSMLIVFILVFLSARISVSPARRTTVDFANAAILLWALLVTVTRSLLGLSVIGILISPLLAFLAGFRNSRSFIRFLLVIFALGTVGASFVFLRSDYTEFWMQRAQAFSRDNRIFSPETVRGLANIAAVDAIRDRPIIGYGVPDYPNRFTLGRADAAGGYHSDIHPLLGVTLSGGVFAVVLFLRLHWVILSRYIRTYRSQRSLALHTIPYLTLVALNIIANSVGAGGTTWGRGLVVAALFLGLLAAETAREFELPASVMRRVYVRRTAGKYSQREILNATYPGDADPQRSSIHEESPQESATCHRISAGVT